MNRRDFKLLVEKAFDELPKMFKDKLENIDIVVEDEPDMDTVRTLRLGSRGRLLGLYQGVPLEKRTHYYGMVLPDKITVYQRNIELFCRQTGADIYSEVKHVVCHEIAHHFGISDEHLKDIGAY